MVNAVLRLLLPTYNLYFKGQQFIYVVTPPLKKSCVRHCWHLLFWRAKSPRDSGWRLCRRLFPSRRWIRSGRPNWSSSSARHSIPKLKFNKKHKPTLTSSDRKDIWRDRATHCVRFLASTGPLSLPPEGPFRANSFRAGRSRFEKSPEPKRCIDPDVRTERRGRPNWTLID